MRGLLVAARGRLCGDLGSSSFRQSWSLLESRPGSASFA